TGEEHDPAISGWARRALTQHRGQTHAVFTKDAEGDESTVEASWSESANAVMVVVELDGVPPLVSVDTVGADAGALTADAVSITNPQDAYLLGFGSVGALLTDHTWSVLQDVGSVQAPAGVTPD